MKYLILAVLASCGTLRQPVDIVQPSPIYCQPLNEDVQECRDGAMRLWRCEYNNGRWSCERVEH